MVYFLFGMSLVVMCYFIFRYITLVLGLKKIAKDLNEMAEQLDQNQMLKLPLPNIHLSQVVLASNKLISEIQQERQSYERREREFKQQIENISHDLRTPLTVILGYLKLMKKDDQRIGINEQLARIEKKAEGMNRLVSQFYDYSRFTTESNPIYLERVDIGRILREEILSNYELLLASNLDVDVQIPESPTFIIGDVVMLNRVFLNLLQNANRYAQSILHIKLIEDETDLKVIFCNDTSELKREDIPNIFNRFYMKDVSRNTDHTGLGLTITKTLVERMNGRIDIEAQEIEGELMSIQFQLIFPKFRN